MSTTQRARTPKAGQAGPAARTVTLEVPTAEPPAGGYISDRIDMRLSPRQARGLRRAAEGLALARARLTSGKFVNGGVEAVRWLLEQLEPPA